MHNLFKSTKYITYIVTWCPVFAILLFYVYRIVQNFLVDRRLALDPVPIFLFIIFMFAWMLIVFTAFGVIADVKTNKVYKILLNDCDPQLCIDTLNSMLRLYDKSIRNNQPRYYRKYNVARTNILLSICSCYLALGDLEAAKQILGGIRHFSDSKSVRLVQEWSLNSNLLAYHIEAGDFENTRKFLEKLDELRNADKLSKFRRDLLRDKYFSILCEYNIQVLNHFEDSEVFLKYFFDKASNMYTKVAVKLLLGQIYLHEEKKAEANDAFHYVINNGNKLQCVEEAKSLIVNL